MMIEYETYANIICIIDTSASIFIFEISTWNLMWRCLVCTQFHFGLSFFSVFFRIVATCSFSQIEFQFNMNTEYMCIFSLFLTTVRAHRQAYALAVAAATVAAAALVQIFHVRTIYTMRNWTQLKRNARNAIWVVWLLRKSSAFVH